MIGFLLLTSFTVSIDSFVCGFSLAFIRGKKVYIVFLIALTVFLMCVIANYLATFLSGFLPENFSSFGGAILIAVGIYNLLKKDKEIKNSSGKIVKQSLISGFAVGLDGAFANISLALMGINGFYVPFVIAFMHALCISFGIFLSKTKLASKFGKISFLPPLILIGLGFYKLLGFFI